MRGKVEAAIEDLRYRVTVGDVAGRAGISLYDTEEALKALAADTQGNLEVSSDGEIVYAFSSDFRSVLRSKSFLLRLEPTLQWMSQAFNYALRTAFGVAFVVTVISVWTSIALISSSSSDGDNRRNRSSYGRNRVMFDLIDIFRLWSFYNNPSPYRDTDKMSFFESVYSFVFGDGDPNKDFDQYQWNIIGKYIQSKGGVVIAEQLAPFLNPSSSPVPDANSFVVDESYMIPVLTRFEGDPVVTEEGKIVYVFPKFQQTGSKFMSAIPAEHYLRENNWQLTKASKSNIFWVSVLGIANLIGVNILNDLVQKAAIQNASNSLAIAYPFLFGLKLYAFAFFLIPAVRWCLNYFKNKDIAERNSARIQRAELLLQPPGALATKMKVAAAFAKRKLLKKEDMVFTSAVDVESQAMKMEEEEFDRKLKERERKKI